MLQFSPTVPSETKLMERFAKIGIGAGKSFDASKFSQEIKVGFRARYRGLLGRFR
jgi:hypothetical protein